jgi:methylated-DNA-[protein]-cysteine S-methyltransferase
MTEICYTHLETPIGWLLLAGSNDGLAHVRFPEGEDAAAPEPGWRRCDESLRDAARQLVEYFAGERREFDLALAPRGTSFQLAVWRALAAIPYGETASYGEVARRLGRPSAARAVGAASGQNPLPIVVPCHRLVGSDGSLTGFAGGLDRKRALLSLEGTASCARFALRAELQVELS